MRAIPRFFAGLVTGVVLTIGVATGGLAGGFWQEIKVELRPLQYYFDGMLKNTANGQYFNGIQNVPLGFIYEGTTYVPLRFMAESLGQEVGYDGLNNIIWVGTPPVKNNQVPNSKDTGKGEISQGEKRLEAYLGISTNDLVKSLGEPQRKDPGEFGFDWWIYNQDYSNYLQVGVREHKVVALYTNSRNWSTGNIKLGAKRDNLVRQMGLTDSIECTYGNASYTFSIPGDTFQKRTLKVENKIATEFFFDIYDNNRLTGVQVTDLETFLQADFNYNVSIRYSGANPIPVKPRLSQADREALARAYEKQIFDLANTARVQRELPLLQWNDGAAAVARSHSEDMLAHNFFSHTSPHTGSLADRLKKAGIKYRSAAENIAQGHSDSINAHEGWMNSLGHRQNLLNKDLKTLGVGVAGKYYTQNFVTY